MQELPRLEINYPSEFVDQALTDSINDRRAAFGNAAIAQIAISVKHVEMDTFLDELAEEYPELIQVFDKFVSPGFIKSWTFDDGSIIVYKYGKFTLWQM